MDKHTQAKLLHAVFCDGNDVSAETRIVTRFDNVENPNHLRHYFADSLPEAYVPETTDKSFDIQIPYRVWWHNIDNELLPPYKYGTSVEDDVEKKLSDLKTNDLGFVHIPIAQLQKETGITNPDQIVEAYNNLLNTRADKQARLSDDKKHLILPQTSLSSLRYKLKNLDVSKTYHTEHGSIDYSNPLNQLFEQDPGKVPDKVRCHIRFKPSLGLTQQEVEAFFKAYKKRDVNVRTTENNQIELSLPYRSYVTQIPPRLDLSDEIVDKLGNLPHSKDIANRKMIIPIPKDMCNAKAEKAAKDAIESQQKHTVSIENGALHMPEATFNELYKKWTGMDKVTPLSPPPSPRKTELSTPRHDGMVETEAKVLPFPYRG